MNERLLVMSALFLTSGPALAMNLADPMDKSGHSVYVGAAKLTGDLSDHVSKTVLSLGYDYTFANGAIFGGYFVPQLLSGTVTVPSKFSSVKAKVFGAYTGYTFDNNLRLTGGMSFTYTETKRTALGYFVSEGRTNVGGNIGLDYVYKGFLVGTRLDTHRVDDINGITIGLNLGYKF